MKKVGKIFSSLVVLVWKFSWKSFPWCSLKGVKWRHTQEKGNLTKSWEAISYNTRMAVSTALRSECLKQVSWRFPGARGWPSRNDTLLTVPLCSVPRAYSNQHSPTIAHKKKRLVTKHRRKTKRTSHGVKTRRNTSRNKRVSINWYNSHLIPLSRGFIFRIRGSLSAFRNAHSPDSGPLSSRLLCLSSQASLPFSLTCSEISSHEIGQRMINIPANYQSLHGQCQTTRLQSTNSPQWQ